MSTLRGHAPIGGLLLHTMFEARKRVFVDLLGWDVPVIAGRYEIDQFDDDHATYVIVGDDDGRHRASARLLPTTRPHILGSLFPQLCIGDPPRGEDIVEITRFCLDRSLVASQRRAARNCLVAGLANHALELGIRYYVGVAEIGWLEQIVAFGWQCRPLGFPAKCGSHILAAVEIEICAETPALLAANGIASDDAPDALAA
nr:acyl-homoserine-lactone synthase [Allosphingosinicella indica]